MCVWLPGIDITVRSQTGITAEDNLRSIPSKAAEEALELFKGIVLCCVTLVCRDVLCAALSVQNVKCCVLCAMLCGC